ncbi:MAG: hypothetical protein Q4A81_02990 [Pasteurellaceae bacterium]|nr:hypothetical protein [Pasteurellaceae bacterium]
MIKKKKILIVQGSLRIGGCTTILRNYLKIFAKQEDYDVTLLLEEAPRNENIPENIKVHHLLSHIEYEFGNISRILISRNIDENKKDYFNSWINEIEYSKEKRLLDFINSTPSINEHYDIIIDFNSSFSNFLQKYDLHPDIKVIQWIHIYDQITRMLQSPEQSRYIFNKFSGFVCIADEMVEYQEQAIQQLNLDKKPITMIYNPFDLENAALKRDELPSEQDQELMKEPYLLSVAGLYNGAVLDN